MTKRDDIEAADENRDEYNRMLSDKGHVMTWRLADNANREGYAYYWIGDCKNCGANITVAGGWTSCQGVRDARSVSCSGPGTTILTEIESARRGELLSEAVDRYIEELNKRSE